MRLGSLAGLWSSARAGGVKNQTLTLHTLAPPSFHHSRHEPGMVAHGCQVLGRKRQKNCHRFKASLGYSVTLSQNKTHVEFNSIKLLGLSQCCLYGKTNKIRDWREGSMVKSANCSSRGSGLSSSTHTVAHN